MENKRGAYKEEEQLKSCTVTVRITQEQQQYIDMLIKSGKAKNKAAAIQYLISKSIVLNPHG